MPRQLGDFPELGMKRVGPGLWLKLSHPHRELDLTKPHKNNDEARKYCYVGKQIGNYWDGTGGWKTTRVVLMGGFIFECSDRTYRRGQLNKYKARRERRRERRKQTNEKESASGGQQESMEANEG